MKTTNSTLYIHHSLSLARSVTQQTIWCQRETERMRWKSLYWNNKTEKSEVLKQTDLYLLVFSIVLKQERRWQWIDNQSITHPHMQISSLKFALSSAKPKKKKHSPLNLMLMLVPRPKTIHSSSALNEMNEKPSLFFLIKKKTKTFLKFLFFQKEFNLRFSLFFVTVIFYVTSDRPNVRDANDGTSLDRRSNIELDPPKNKHDLSEFYCFCYYI